jgi:hypothetical protein
MPFDTKSLPRLGAGLLALLAAVAMPAPFAAAHA